MREILFEYGFESVNGIVKKQYHLHDIPLIAMKCDVWNVLPLVYIRQYTGEQLHGVKLFDGDVIGVCEVGLKFIVKWIRDGWYLVDKDGYGDRLYRQLDEIKNMAPDIKILSNIHNNPELLEK